MNQNWAPERADSATLHPGTEVSFRRIARGSWDCEVADHLNRSARFVKIFGPPLQPVSPRPIKPRVRDASNRRALTMFFGFQGRPKRTA
jgi:hypothetical protein